MDDDATHVNSNIKDNKDQLKEMFNNAQFPELEELPSTTASCKVWTLKIMNKMEWRGKRRNPKCYQSYCRSAMKNKKAELQKLVNQDPVVEQ
jgi:hypothetical protein